MTTAVNLGGGVSVTPRPLFTPGKDPIPIVQEAGWEDRCGQAWEISPPPGFDPRTVQPVASRYTDYATRPTDNNSSTYEILLLAILILLFRVAQKSLEATVNIECQVALLPLCIP
jgi:hypothetical protein